MIFKTNDAILIKPSELNKWIEILSFYEIKSYPLYFDSDMYIYLYLNKNKHIEAYCCLYEKKPFQLNIFEHKKFLEYLKQYIPYRNSLMEF